MLHDRITVWRLTAHHAAPAEALRWFLQSNIIAIGWGEVGSIETGRFRSAKDISDAIRVTYPGSTNAGNGGPSLYDFCFTMTRGDLVIVSAARRRRCVMEVVGDYTHRPAPEPKPIGEYQNQRRATSVAIDPDALWHEVDGGPRKGQSIYRPLIRCRKDIDVARKNALMTQ